jgi:protein-S-isoprenylcysteine O-methyltransferase Ste14
MHFRVLFILSTLALIAIRFYAQSQVLREAQKVEIKESGLSLLAGGLAALTTIVFGVEYIVSPGSFAFAYALPYPNWLRWLGVVILGGGVALLWAAHLSLGKSFHSLIVAKAGAVLVETGPYRWIRHPIYLAYLLSYVGGGLVASNLVLTVVPAAFYAILVGLRLPREEHVLAQQFGGQYQAYLAHTGRLLPRFGPRG